ncbi:hypothetical protein FK268_11800 [Tsukamurella sputi]|uniref:DUF5671 domain-containing protein n=1 Tax=Tsukamurella sputi TaxID=2591848 RepID=A0A5C5RMJ0_9ACTN|nr:hypothetical protein [Tsukamurella sputi]TWS24279.1 hypothetical protein FK268_11800 [Tsukamurella sputi]
MIIGILTIAALVWVIRGTGTEEALGESPSYTEYRRVLRRRLVVAFGVSTAALLVLIAAIFISTFVHPSTAENVLPRPIQQLIGLAWVPGLFLFPLLALLVTERTTRPDGPRIATLTPHGPFDIVPRWMTWTLIAFTAATAISPVTLLIAEGSDDSFSLWSDYAGFVLALIVTALVIVAAARRPDIDPLTGTDGWSRRGTAIRALCLLFVAEAVVLTDAVSTVRNSLGHPLVADGTGLLLFALTAGALSIFARPHLAAPASERGFPTADHRAARP